MMDFIIARKKAFEELSKVETVSEITNPERKKRLGFSVANDVWEIVDTEIEGRDGKVELVTLHLLFELDFPLSLPTVFLSPEDHQRLRYLPHINTKRHICTYDTDTVRTVPNNSGGIVKICVSQAKQIIADGLNGRNFSDFEEEFLAYWELEYGNKDKIEKNVLSLISSEPSNTSLKVICLEKKLQHFEYVFHVDDVVANRFKSLLNDRKIKYTEVQGFYAGELKIDINPPHVITNRKVVQLIAQQGAAIEGKYKRFINNWNSGPIVVAFKKTLGRNEVYLGWIHQKLVARSKISGFRPGTYKKFHALTMHQSGENVLRLLPESIMQTRLQTRTDGIPIKKEWNDLKFVIAGVGSVGSYITHFLNAIGSPEFRLIDTQVLGVENIQRHLLGFDFVGYSKASSLRHHLLSLNPIQEISFRDKSIVEVYLNEPNYINNSDYLVVAIGKSNIDAWLAATQKEGGITIPMFMLWVEPYLCGAHCLYLYPSDAEYQSLFDEDGLFKYNIIDASEYKSSNKYLLLREAGCQTTYVPYGTVDLLKFIGEIFPKIINVVEKKINKSKTLSWIGNLKRVEELGIKLSKFAQENKDGGIITIE